MCGIALILSHRKIDDKNPLMASLKSALNRRGPDRLGLSRVSLKDEKGNNEENSLELCLIGAELQLRGINAISQPLISPSGNILIFNGEIFGGINVSPDQNDAEILLEKLEQNYDENNNNKSVPDIISLIRGPYAFLYFEKSRKRIWFGRDAFGRRSLLIHWPTSDDPNFIISSIAPPNFTKEDYWEEMDCGINSIDLNDIKLNESLFNKVIKYEWRDPLLINLVNWSRENYHENIHHVPQPNLANRVLEVLKESVMKRTIVSNIQRDLTTERDDDVAPIAVLFSGGLDSMIIAALLDRCLDPQYTIDLINVSFDGHRAPDRISGRVGVRELQKIAPLRRWRLIEVDSCLSDLNWENERVMSLIHPSKTYMDLNIGIALWLAAQGDGFVDHKLCKFSQYKERYRYKSKSKVVLIGSGADEQCAGYGRQRTKFRLGGWSGLNEEMKLDMQRIWKRNMGRDDRCISDHGKEARFPFLDENVIKTLLELPLCDIANLNEPIGFGDKKILRQVAMLLGLEEAAVMPKRAIQFGTRIARESNRINFGSNRAANQASAGSADIYSSE